MTERCSAPVTTFSLFAGVGRTASMLDEELLILGDDYLGTRRQYISIQKPRDGLLAMKYTIHEFPLRQAAHEQTSLVSGNTLTVLGGKLKSRGKFSKFVWTELSLKWEDGSEFIPDFISACAVKLEIDVHIVFGGERQGNKGETNSGRQVFKINTTEEVVYELSPMALGRISHGCQVLNRGVVLVSGGLAKKGQDSAKVLQDELYFVDSQEHPEVLGLQQSLRRFQHALVRIGEKVLALGGLDSNNNAPTKIEEFNPTSKSWTKYRDELHSKETSEIIFTPYPASSLDISCGSPCQCGKTPKRRIFGGSEAKVRLFQ